MNQIRDSLVAFVEGACTYSELREALRGCVRVTVTGGEERIEFLSSLPTVAYSLEHIDRALARYLDGHGDAKEMAAWASVILLFDCFRLEVSDRSTEALALGALQHLSAPAVSGALEPENARAWRRRLSLRSLPDKEE